MNLERTKPETLAAAALDLTPSHFTAAHDYAERLNAALARLGLTDRLTLPPAPNTAIDELPGVVDVPLRKTLSVFADVLKETLTPYSPAVTISDDGDYIINHDNRHLIKEVILKVDTSESVLLEYIRRGGKFAFMKFNAIESLPIKWEDVVAGDDVSNFMTGTECSIETMQKALNILRDGISYNNFFDSTKVIGVGEEAFLKMPVGFHGIANNNDIFVSTTIPTYLTLDFADWEYTGRLFTWGSVNRLKPINTSKLKDFMAGTTNFPIDAFDCDGLIRAPWREGIHTSTTTLGGFINIGKGFLQNGSASAHLMYFDSYMQNLSHDSLVNIFNGLYDLNLHTFQFTNQPTIQLGATNYSRVSAAEIKIATDKGWIVTK